MPMTRERSQALMDLIRRELPTARVEELRHFGQLHPFMPPAYYSAILERELPSARVDELRMRGELA